MGNIQPYSHFSKKHMKKKLLFSVAMILATTTSIFAQGNGMQGITDATNMVTSYFDPAV